MRITEIIEEQKELTEEQRNKLAIQITENFSKWDDDRSSQVATARNIMQEVYLNQTKRKKENGLEWESDVKLNALYNIRGVCSASCKRITDFECSLYRNRFWRCDV